MGGRRQPEQDGLAEGGLSNKKRTDELELLFRKRQLRGSPHLSLRAHLSRVHEADLLHELLAFDLSVEALLLQDSDVICCLSEDARLCPLRRARGER